MKTAVDARLVAEANRFGLRFACEDCAHFIAANGRCAHGYPPAPLRSALDSPAIVFCKEFELGDAGETE